LRDSMQAGRAIRAATECLSRFERAPMDGPLLYVNRVDPLPYYAGCETAFSHLSVRVTAPDKFLIRFRPEFVVLSGYKARPSITVRPEYSQDLFDRLKKSYTLAHQQDNLEMWESLWSPYLSILGLLQTEGEAAPETRLVDDLDAVHVGIRADAERSPMEFDLSGVSKPGRRWLHGWVIAYNPPYLDPIPITVRDEAGRVLGVVVAAPQKDRPRWQEFWIWIGDLPERLRIAWPEGSVVLGDLRLMNEILWARDLTRALASEIERATRARDYEETLLLQENGRPPVVLHHPGFGAEAIQLPPMRLGLKKELSIRYGLSPSAYSSSDGVRFRVSIFDHALGREDVLLDEFVDPRSESAEQAWRTRRVSLLDYSRHVVDFTFAVDSGPRGDSTSDHAIWREIKILDSP
ncbi:MAG: hypothetical protein JXR73_01870, partial [Candidatus Omnitrophica bacterium]|nr:hypothetical protein [Candidatus Omnitrophota bacterium]